MTLPLDPTYADLRRPGPGDRVLVVSGSYGAGHDAAAREIRRRLEDGGVVVSTADVVDLFPLGIGRALRWLYFAQLDRVPTSWGGLLRVLGSSSRVGRVVSAVVLAVLGWLPSRRLRRVLPVDVRCVVSTHPFPSQALGRLRRRGRLGAPAVTYLTDASVHPLWVAAGVDCHLAIHAAAAGRARELGAAGVRLVRPLVPEARPTADPVLVRAAWGVPCGTPVALVVGGSEGVGDLVASARDLRDSGLVVPVVVCGRNDTLRRRLAAEPGVVALGWLDGLADAIAASDVVVHNAGGFTTLEALAQGRPLISYRCLPGHGADNAAALEAEGLARWPQHATALAGDLAEALACSSTWAGLVPA